jgi:hypothetical protein
MVITINIEILENGTGTGNRMARIIMEGKGTEGECHDIARLISNREDQSEIEKLKREVSSLRKQINDAPTVTVTKDASFGLAGFEDGEELFSVYEVESGEYKFKAGEPCTFKMLFTETNKAG